MKRPLTRRTQAWIGRWSLTAGFALLLLAGGLPAQAKLALRAPLGFPRPVPGSEAFRPAAAALGRALFFDPILSVDRQTACARCHLPSHGFASVEALPPGSLGRRSARNAPSLFNAAYGTVFSWDGRAKNLEEQVILPIANPLEMALPLDDALERLRGSATYGPQFRAVFGRPAVREDLATALASYVRTLVHGGSDVDRFRAGQRDALSVKERAGLWIYESKGGCWKCHSGPNFADDRFHNTGVGVVGGKAPAGRMGVTGKPADAGAFKTPTLRALTDTGPYMHDGSLRTLEEVVAFYRRGGNPNPGLDPKLKPLQLTDAEAGNLVAFLRALSRVRSEARTTRDRTP